MKRMGIGIAFVAVALRSFSQTDMPPPLPSSHVEQSAQAGSRKGAYFNQRTYQFMDKMLTDMNVDDATREQVKALQASYQKKIAEIGKRTGEARETIQRLEAEGASLEEIDKAIDVMVAAQAEMMRMMVRNRRSMENLIGKANYAAILEAARQQYREQRTDRRGPGLPPRPSFPPLPPHSKTAPTSTPLPPFPK
jgi:hypothetical protein